MTNEFFFPSPQKEQKQYFKDHFYAHFLSILNPDSCQSNCSRISQNFFLMTLRGGNGFQIEELLNVMEITTRSLQSPKKVLFEPWSPTRVWIETWQLRICASFNCSLIFCLSLGIKGSPDSCCRQSLPQKTELECDYEADDCVYNLYFSKLQEYESWIGSASFLSSLRCLEQEIWLLWWIYTNGSNNNRGCNSHQLVQVTITSFSLSLVSLSRPTWCKLHICNHHIQRAINE